MQKQTNRMDKSLQAENMNKRRKLPKKDKRQNAENRSFDQFGLRFVSMSLKSRNVSRFFLSPANS